MAFIDIQLYFHQMISLKHFILAACHEGYVPASYQSDSKRLSLRSRDTKPLKLYSMDFMVDNI